MLRMFSPVSVSRDAEVNSYAFKHTVEWFLDPHVPYVSNGRLIWAAAALGFPMADPWHDGPNLVIGVSEREHDYVTRMVGPWDDPPRTNRYRPAKYEHMRAALARVAVKLSPQS